MDMTLTLRRRDPFRSLWTVPTMWEDEWFDMNSDQGLSMYETDEEIIVEANVAGVPEDQVEISIEGGTVSIKAHYMETDEEKSKKKVVYRQAREASYAYSISVPTPVKQDAAEASIDNGILKLILPKKEEAKPKRIEIRAKAK